MTIILGNVRLKKISVLPLLGTYKVKMCTWWGIRASGYSTGDSVDCTISYITEDLHTLYIEHRRMWFRGFCLYRKSAVIVADVQDPIEDIPTALAFNKEATAFLSDSLNLSNGLFRYTGICLKIHIFLINVIFRRISWSHIIGG